MPSPESAISSTKPKPPRRSSFRLPLGRLMRIYGHSMSPLLHPGQLVLVDEDAYSAREPQLGEIVAVRPVSLGGQAVVKRIAGLPKEQIRFGGREWQLGEEEFFLVGDHSEHSLDSRIFGPVNRDEMVGPVTVRVWPWKRLSHDHRDGDAAERQETATGRSL